MYRLIGSVNFVSIDDELVVYCNDQYYGLKGIIADVFKYLYENEAVEDLKGLSQALGASDVTLIEKSLRDLAEIEVVKLYE